MSLAVADRHGAKIRQHRFIGPNGLDRLFAQLEPVLPELVCPPPGPADVVLSAEQCASGFSAMRDHWRQAHPEAGPHYVAMRCWGVAVWQPAYLCVLAAHLHTHVPRLDGMRQQWSAHDGSTNGLWLPTHELRAGSLRQRVRWSASEIVRFAAQMRMPARRTLGLKDRAADAVLAECVLAALLLVARNGQNDTAWALRWAAIWLRETGLEGACGLRHRADPAECPTLMLDRSLCCHHFRRHDGEKCASCPKRSIPVCPAAPAALLPRSQEGFG